MFFRNVCVVALVVLCGHAASAFTLNMLIGILGKFFTQLLSLGVTCLEQNKATDVITNPCPENVVRGCGCLAGCAMKMGGLLNADGTVNSKLILASIPEKMPMATEVKQIVTDCSAKGGDTCHAFLNLIKCIIADGPFKALIEAIKKFFAAIIMECIK